MAVRFRLYLMLMLVIVVRNTDSLKPESPKSPTRHASVSTPSRSKKPPLCVAEKMQRKDSDVHVACSGACVKFSHTINEFCKQHPDHKTGNSLRGICGSFDGGSCNFMVPGAVPACSCHAPEKKPVYLQVCQKSFAPIREWTNTGVLIKHHGQKLTEHGQKFTEHGKKITEHGVKLGQRANEEIRKRTTTKNRDKTDKAERGIKSPRTNRTWKARFNSFTKKLKPGAKVESELERGSVVGDDASRKG